MNIRSIILSAIILFCTSAFAASPAMWSKGPHKTWQENATAHWHKHKDEFPEFKTAQEYITYANNFVKNPPIGTYKKIEKDGDILFYHKKSNIFAVKSKQGPPRTMFRPDAGIKYWNKQ